MNIPKIKSANPELAEKINLLDLIITLAFFLFALACNFSISLTQIAGFAGVGALLVRLHFTQSWNQLKLVLLWPFLSLLLAWTLSTLLSVDHTLSLLGFQKVALFVIFLWVINAAPYISLRPFQKFLARFLKLQETIAPLTLVIYVLIAATAVSALYGLTQAFSPGDLIPNRKLIHGTLSHVFTFSAILMMVGLLAFARILFGAKNRPWLWISFLVISLCLALTFTRMVWLGYFTGLTFLLFFKKRYFAILPPALLIIMLIFGPDTIANRLMSIVNFESGSVALRLKMWEASLDVIADYPWTGCGYNCLYLIHDQYPQHAILQKFYYNLHSNLIQITVDLGFLGVAAWLSLWIGYFIILIRRYRNCPQNSTFRWIILGSAAVVISFLFCGIFETNFYDSEVVMVLYFIMALPFVASNNAQSAPSDPPSSSIPR